MHHSEYAIRLFVEQHNAELVAAADRLNRRPGPSNRSFRRRVRSLLARFRSTPPAPAPAPAPPVIDLREPPPTASPEPVPVRGRSASDVDQFPA